MEEGLAIPEIVGDTEINRGDRVELNYCQQGLPAGASYRPAGSKWGQSVTSSQTGDPGCQGYALKFVYTTGGLEADQCLSESAARNQLWSNYGSMSHSAPVAGAYGQYDSDSRRDRAYGPLAGAPYTNNHLPWSQASTAGQCADYPNRYTTVGQWVIDREPQRGWGKFNAGAPIANGTYLASFSFDFGSETSALTATATSTVGGIGGDNGAEITGSTCPTLTGTNVRPGVCWSLKADYEGYVNLIRVSAYRKQPESQIDGQFIKVYGAKASR
jgi:hypothetical protein